MVVIVVIIVPHSSIPYYPKVRFSGFKGFLDIPEYSSLWDLRAFSGTIRVPLRDL